IDPGDDRAIAAPRDHWDGLASRIGTYRDAVARPARGSIGADSLTIDIIRGAGILPGHDAAPSSIGNRPRQTLGAAEGSDGHAVRSPRWQPRSTHVLCVNGARSPAVSPENDRAAGAIGNGPG